MFKYATFLPKAMIFQNNIRATFFKVVGYAFRYPLHQKQEPCLKELGKHPPMAIIQGCADQPPCARLDSKMIRVDKDIRICFATQFW